MTEQTALHEIMTILARNPKLDLDCSRWQSDLSFFYQLTKNVQFRIEHGEKTEIVCAQNPYYHPKIKQ